MDSLFVTFYDPIICYCLMILIWEWSLTRRISLVMDIDRLYHI